MAKLPSFRNYGEYSSSNYGAHSLVFSTPKIEIYFSYDTPVAFRAAASGLVVRQNDWHTTTGKHLNWIDGGSKEAKAARIPGAEFEKRLAAELA